MKTITAITLAMLLAFTAKAPEPQPKMTLIAGVCAGVVIGFLGGLSIYLVYKCATLIPPVVQDTNPPSWTVPPPEPPADTNAPPTNSPVKIPVLQVENSAQTVTLGPGWTGYLTTLEGSDDLKAWGIVAHVQTYATGTNSWSVAYDSNWVSVAAGPSLFLQSSNRFYRTVLTR